MDGYVIFEEAQNSYSYEDDEYGYCEVTTRMRQLYHPVDLPTPIDFGVSYEYRRWLGIPPTKFPASPPKCGTFGPFLSGSWSNFWQHTVTLLDKAVSGFEPTQDPVRYLSCESRLGPVNQLLDQTVRTSWSLTIPYESTETGEKFHLLLNMEQRGWKSLTDSFSAASWYAYTDPTALPEEIVEHVRVNARLESLASTRSGLVLYQPQGGASDIPLTGFTSLLALGDLRANEAPYFVASSNQGLALVAWNNGQPESIGISGVVQEGNYIGQRISNNLVIPTGQGLWRNGRELDSQHLGVGRSSQWSAPSLKCVSPSGEFVAGTRRKLEDEDGNSIPPVNQEKHAVLLLPAEIVPNFDRNETIDLASKTDRGKVCEASPWRWWKNDDSDLSSQEYLGNDIPGRLFTVLQNYSNSRVDGTRDLVDFFPLLFDIRNVVQMLSPSNHVYKLRHADSALKFVYTNLTADQADDFLVENLLEYGIGFNKRASEAETWEVNQDGIDLNVDFLSKIANEEGKGILLFEGCSSTKTPLVLEVWKESRKVCEVHFPLEIAAVEDMYRRVNVRGINPAVGLDGSGGFKTQIGQPSNYPDNLTNGKWFAFVHGFEVDAERGRGWNAEVFKRMHQLGSRARFVAVQWYGDTGGTRYHSAVENAFHTSELLAASLHFVTGDLTIAAHSLGNMLVSNAIAHEGLRPDRYYMINGAVPLEAYDRTISHDGPRTNEGRRIVHDDWKGYWTRARDQRRVYSSYWHSIFDARIDKRALVRWGDRFSRANPIAYNFYSSGEDVVEDAATSETVLQNYSVLFNNWLAGKNDPVLRGGGTHAWVAQEILKGSPLIVGTRQGGWGFTEGPGLAYVGDGELNPMQPEQTNYLSVTDEEIAQFGLFYSFAQLGLHAPIDDANALPGVTGRQADASSLVDQATPAGKDLLFELLATGVPSRSYAAAANPIQRLEDFGRRNFNLQQMRNGWPVEAIKRDEMAGRWRSGRWRHSDFKDVALLYVHPFYQTMIEIGDLKK